MTNDPSAIDPGGRHVILHHHIDAILQAISRPDHREQDPLSGRERFYLRHIFARRWLRIAVDFNESPAFVVTAFVQDNQPGAKP
jgi:hypothetical protein